MLRAHRIVVFARGSSADDPAISRAFALAKHCGSRVKLLDVFDELPEQFEPLLSSLKVKDAREEAQRERRGELSRIAEHLREHGIPTEFEVRWGKPAIEVVQQTMADSHDLLIVEDDKPRGVHAPVHSIVRHCPTPVWIVKNAPHGPPPRVLAAIDPIGITPGAFDSKVLEYAAGAAEAMHAELYVVHAWQPLHNEFEWLPDGFRRLSEKQDVIEQTRVRHAQAVEGVVRSILKRFDESRYRLVEGPPGEAVLEAVEEIGADLLVMGTARSALYAHLLLGKTAEMILEHVPVSVLAVKPSGFVSPLSR